jgi:hypothetical protein
VNAEIDVYALELSWVLDQLAVSLDGLSDQHIAERPGKAANSPFTIVHHVIGATRAYGIGLGSGRPVSRDRPAEFGDQPVSGAELLGQLASFKAELLEALRTLDPAWLDERMVPPRELYGEGDPHEMSRRQAIVDSIRHAAIHLGELRLTRDLIAG